MHLPIEKAHEIMCFQIAFPPSNAFDNSILPILAQLSQFEIKNKKMVNGEKGGRKKEVKD